MWEKVGKSEEHRTHWLRQGQSHTQHLFNSVFFLSFPSHTFSPSFYHANSLNFFCSTRSLFPTTTPQGELHPSVGGWYLLCTVVCVMGLYIVTLICDLWHTVLAKSLLWLDPVGWTPRVAPVCTFAGFRRGGVASCWPFLVGTVTELEPGRSVLDSDWLSWMFSLCSCSFGRLFDFFSRIICRTEKLVRFNTAIQQKNKTSKQRGILINICNLFYRVSNKYNFGTRYL